MIPDILAHHLILSQVLSPQPREGDILPQNPLLARLILRISFSYLSLLHIGQGHLLTSSYIFSPTSYCDGIPIPVLHLLLQFLWVKWKRNAGAALLLFFFFLFFFAVFLNLYLFAIRAFCSSLLAHQYPLRSFHTWYFIYW